MLRKDCHVSRFHHRSCRHHRINDCGWSNLAAVRFQARQRQHLTIAAAVAKHIMVAATVVVALAVGVIGGLLLFPVVVEWLN